MPRLIKLGFPAAGAAVSLMAMLWTLWWAQWLLAALCGIGFAAAVAALAFGALRRNNESADTNASQSSSVNKRAAPEPMVRRTPTVPGDLADEMIAANRYALLLRPQIAQNLSKKQLDAAREALEEDMALVPEGDVFLSQPDERDEHERPMSASGGRVLNVTARGQSVSEAQTRAYSAIEMIDWPGGFCRRDIGWRAVEREGSGQ